VLKNAVLKHVRLVTPAMRPLMFVRHESVSAAHIEEHGFESTKIADILKAKGKNADGSWLWCTTEDTVYDAVKSMTQHNVGALVVVKPGEQKSIAGIITERDYLRKIIVQGRSSKSTKVGDIMTEEVYFQWKFLKIFYFHCRNLVLCVRHRSEMQEILKIGIYYLYIMRCP
ncbi:CBS domain-containing protein CBSX3, mitochondrial-like, partial [Olea europaea var. sylvestris]|uniref:CBS domain-containing protein CBSX3, mitochondrial-like n=1 Tax=Olea europaea var. sylvestris TaxID=158386 RepID=UPI000C1D37C3